MTRLVALVLGAACVLLSARPAHAELERFTDSQGQKIARDGAITCVYYNATSGMCGRSLPPEQGQAWHMMPTHYCSRPSETGAWTCQPRDSRGGETPEQQQAILQVLTKGAQVPVIAATPPATPPSPKITQRIGTGFVVRPDGVLLTAYHVVKDAREIEISCPEVPNASASLAQFSEANDLAVLRLSGIRTPTYLSLAEQTSAAVGDGVFTVGYPAPALLGGEAKFTEGVISSLSVGGDAGYMQISVPVQPGNSGGALVNRSGEVVGVVIATASALTFLKGTGSLPQNVSWAVKGAFASPLFDQPPHSPGIADRGAIIRRAVNATCFVKVSVPEDR